MFTQTLAEFVIEFRRGSDLIIQDAEPFAQRECSAQIGIDGQFELALGRQIDRASDELDVAPTLAFEELHVIAFSLGRRLRQEFS